MPRYNVIVTRDVTESTYLSVEADNPEDAEDAALLALSLQTDTVWTIDDGSWNHGDTYITGVMDDDE